MIICVVYLCRHQIDSQLILKCTLNFNYKNMKHLILSSLKTVFLLVCIFIFNSLQAAVINFTGATNNDWATGSNWSTGSVPTSSDVAYINASEMVIISAETTVTVQRVEMASSSNLVNNGTLTITPTSETGNALYMSGSNTFTNSGTLTLNNASQVTAVAVVNYNGTGNLLTFNGTNNISSVSGKNLFTSSASASATISGNGFTIGSSTAGALYSIFNLTAAGCSLTIDSGTTLNLYVDFITGPVYGNGFYMSNSSSAVNNGTINVFKGTNASGRALIIYNTVNSTTATFTNNGTFNVSELSAPIIYNGTAGTARNGTLNNTGTLSIQANVTTAINMSSANITSTLTNSGTITINSNTTAISLPASASGTFQNTGTITITKGNINSGATAGSFPTLNNNSGGILNFNYGVAAGTTAAANNVIVSNNSGATINGSCTFAANTLVTAAGSTLSPGDYSNGASGYGIINLTPSATGTKFPLNGNVLMQLKGTTGEGTNFDRIKCTEIDVTGASLTVEVSYTPAVDNYISLIYAATSKTGPLSSTYLPRGWISSPNALNEAVKYYPSLPGAPTAVVATAGNAKASVAFTAPASDGGADITSYTVTSSPGDITATGATSPLTVSGLSNETAYTFTVTATNIRGTGSASTASGSVTPSATANIIPVSSSTYISSLTLTPVSDVEVSNDALLTINQSTTINSLTIAAGGMVTNASTLNTPVLTINSNAADGTGTYIDNGTSNVTTLNANQYLGTTRNWYISSPVQSTVSSTTNISRYYEYVEAGNNADLLVEGSTAYWKGYNPGHTMTAGKGYIVLPSAAGASVSFSGTMNTGDITIPLSKSGNGFNLIGNPYPSHLTWTKAYVDSKASLIEPTIWYRTNTGSVNSGGDAAWSFKTINASTGEASPLGTTNIIPPMQAFWVKAVAAGNLVLNSDLAKSHETTNPLKVPTANNTNRQRVRLEVFNGTTTDEALIYFDTAASDFYDAYDSPKYPVASTVTQLYSIAGAEKLVINGMNSIQLETPIQLGFIQGNATTFTIRANEITNIPEGVNVILKDNFTQSEIDVTDGTAAYNFAPATTTTGRFTIIFRSAGIVNGGYNLNDSMANISVNDQKQIVIKAFRDTDYSIYTISGVCIVKGIANQTNEVKSSVLSAGVYIVKLNNYTKRIILN